MSNSFLFNVSFSFSKGYISLLCRMNFLPVPHCAPRNLRLTKLQFDEVKVQWDSIPQHSFKGRLLGYIVYYCSIPYTMNTDICRFRLTYVETVTIKSPGAEMAVLSGLKTADVYGISVAAFSSTGVGPKASWRRFQTGNSITTLTICGFVDSSPTLRPVKRGVSHRGWK